jgi:hypothetical protein
MIPIGEGHFRRAVTEFVDHYHRERNHQGIQNQLIAGAPPVRSAGRVKRQARLGGLPTTTGAPPDCPFRQALRHYGLWREFVRTTADRRWSASVASPSAAGRSTDVGAPESQATGPRGCATAGRWTRRGRRTRYAAVNRWRKHQLPVYQSDVNFREPQLTRDRIEDGARQMAQVAPSEETEARALWASHCLPQDADLARL